MPTDVVGQLLNLVRSRANHKMIKGWLLGLSQDELAEVSKFWQETSVMLSTIWSDLKEVVDEALEA